MARSLVDAVRAVQDIVGAVEGLRGAPDQPPEKITVFPFSIAYPGPIDWVRGSSGMIKGLPHIILEIHQARKDLPRDILKITPYGEIVGRLLWSDTNVVLPDSSGTATVDTIVEMATDFFPKLGYGSLDTMGWQFVIQVKIW